MLLDTDPLPISTLDKVGPANGLGRYTRAADLLGLDRQKAGSIYTLTPQLYRTVGFRPLEITLSLLCPLLESPRPHAARFKCVYLDTI